MAVSTAASGWIDLKFVTVETFIIQFVILLIVLWVLNKFVFKPYLAYLDELEAKKLKVEEDYANIDKLVAEAEAEKEKILSEARATSDKIISDTEELAAANKTKLIEKAENEAKDILASWRWEIEKERLTMLNGVKSKLIDLIIKFNSKLFSDEKISKEYIDKELGNLK